MTEEAQKELEEIRQQLDDIDDQFIDLLAKRLELVRRVEKIKEGEPIIRPDREEKILERLLDKAANLDPPIDEAVVSALWFLILSACLKAEFLQREQRKEEQ